MLPLRMPRCVVASSTGSQMASTQWERGRSANICFSGACMSKQRAISECMKHDPRMVSVPSVTLETAFLMAGAWLSGAAGIKRRPLSLLKVDCEGCEHELMPQITAAREGGRALRVTGECHAVANLSEAQKVSCLRELRGETCAHGITYFLTCRSPRPPPKGKTR